jgi:diaminopimelate epimerase
MPDHSINLSFSKYHGTGNDFLVIDGKMFPGFKPGKEVVGFLCDRHFGIGADGLIIIHPSEEYGFRMQYFNADGLEGTMCGNGGRVAVAYAIANGNVSAENEVTFLASDGVHHASAFYSNESGIIVELNLNNTVFPFSPIPDTFFIDTGSPHLVIFTNDASLINVPELGRKYRYAHELQPNGANINFVSSTENGIFVRTYERGVENETLSCGTGVTASAIVWAVQNKLINLQTIHIQTPGGSLQVSFIVLHDKITNVKLKGPATKVFEGTIIL